LKLEQLRVPAAKAYASPLRAAVTPARAVAPASPARAAKVGVASETQAAGGEDRRRSQRVLVRVRASLHVALQGKPTTFETVTLSVNNHGAMLILKQSLPPDTRFVLEHSGTRERVACKVVRPSREMAEGFQIPIEFDSPAPNFWRITFPPNDWRPLDDL
jgi:PilZ domain